VLEVNDRVLCWVEIVLSCAAVHFRKSPVRILEAIQFTESHLWFEPSSRARL
jgi:hypothetical protein